MCGRFVSSVELDKVAAYFAVDLIKVDDPPDLSWNVCPTERVLAVAEHDGRRLLGTFRWGLEGRHINARAETIAAKPSFRASFAGRRCLIPASAFYEWRDKKPVMIRRRDGEPLAFAGIWAGGECAIVTTAANDTLRPIHDRMPVILDSPDWGEWLDRSVRSPSHLLRAAPDDLLEFVAADPRVGNVRNKGPFD